MSQHLTSYKADAEAVARASVLGFGGDSIDSGAPDGALHGVAAAVERPSTSSCLPPGLAPDPPATETEKAVFRCANMRTIIIARESTAFSLCRLALGTSSFTDHDSIAFGYLLI